MEKVICFSCHKVCPTWRSFFWKQEHVLLREPFSQENFYEHVNLCPICRQYELNKGIKINKYFSKNGKLYEELVIVLAVEGQSKQKQKSAYKQKNQFLYSQFYFYFLILVYMAIMYGVVFYQTN